MKRKKTAARPNTSPDINSLASELSYAGDREVIARTCTEISDHLRTLSLPEEYLVFLEIGRAPKRNFAQRLSGALAQKIADALRPTFPGIYPDASGRGHEREQQGPKGSRSSMSYSPPGKRVCAYLSRSKRSTSKTRKPNDIPRTSNALTASCARKLQTATNTIPTRCSLVSFSFQLKLHLTESVVVPA